METSASNSSGFGSTVNSAATTVISWLNVISNALGETLFAPIAFLPGWLSAAIIASVAGAVLILMFKYTSNQHALDKIRNDFKANLFATKLFKENMAASLRAQGGLFVSAFWLFVYALMPGLIMLLPVVLIIAQLSHWYESQPFEVSAAPPPAKTQGLQSSIQPLRFPDEAAVVLRHNGNVELAEVRLEVPKGIEVVRGPVRAVSKTDDQVVHEVCWDIKAREWGNHKVTFVIKGERVDKDLAVGDGFQRISTFRPSWYWWDVLLYPMEKPFPPESLVQSIEVKYPARPGPDGPASSGWWDKIVWFITSIPVWGYSGEGAWLIYFMVVSMIAGFIFAKVFHVNIGM